MANDNKKMNHDQKQAQGNQGQRQGKDDQMGNRGQQGNREQQGDRGQQGPQGGQGNKNELSQGRQGQGQNRNKGSATFANEDTQPVNDKLIHEDDEVERGNDLDAVSGEITEKSPRQGPDIERDRR
jgi:Ca-activated chloride channel homolog